MRLVVRAVVRAPAGRQNDGDVEHESGTNTVAGTSERLKRSVQGMAGDTKKERQEAEASDRSVSDSVCAGGV